MLVACSDAVLERRPFTEPEDTVLIVDLDAGVSREDELSTDENAVLGVDPTHGPFSGGQSALIRGNGFTSSARVWLGGQELPASSVVALDPNRLQVVVPPGAPGPADVSVQIGDDPATSRTLADAYFYDAFSVEPSSGPTSGGSRITLIGQGTAWNDSTRVTIDLRPCEVASIADVGNGVQHLECITPEGRDGRKVVSTQTDDQDVISVTGAFTYSDAASAEGGILGGPLDSQLQVIVRDDLFGTPLGGINVVLGRGTEPGQVAVSDDTGSATFAGDLGPTQTITVVGECVQPLTLVDVPSDFVVLYLEPILSPPCLPPSLDIPTIGGGAGAAPLNRVVGELSWGTGIENKRASWRNVPEPLDDDEEQVAYVFELTSSTRGGFRLPSRIHAVTPEDPGIWGYEFGYDTRSLGNVTLYAFAGLESRRSGTRKFAPYSMGILSGVDPSDEDGRPTIPMDIVLDHRLVIDVETPLRGDRGPDRLQLELLLRVGRQGFIPLPQSERSLLLPLGDTVEYVGVPPLIYGLDGAEYVVSASAVTGSDESPPLADVEAIAARTTDRAIPVRDFIEIPRLIEPAQMSIWQGSELRFDTNLQGTYDLWTVDLLAGGDAFWWRVVSPATRGAVSLPDLREFGAAIPDGPARVSVSAARVRDFDYRQLKQSAFGSSGWSAYSRDVFSIYAE